MEQELLAQALSLPTVAQLLYPQLCLTCMFAGLGLCWEEQTEFFSFLSMPGFCRGAPLHAVSRNQTPGGQRAS